LIDDIIKFYQSFDEYKQASPQLLHYHLEPSISLNQYKIFGDEEITGFINWAYLNDVMKMKVMHHGIIDYGNWKCGTNLVFGDLLCRKNLRDMIKWAKKYFGSELGYDKEVIWIKTFKNNRIVRVNKNVKYS